MRRCTHENQKSHVFKNGDCMWVCLDCGAGGGHYDQSTPLRGKLYRKGGVIDDAEESVDPVELDESEPTEQELQPLTFAALADDGDENTEYRESADETEPTGARTASQ